MIPTGKKITLKSKSKQKNINGNATNITSVTTSSSGSNTSIHEYGTSSSTSSSYLWGKDFKPIVKGPNTEITFTMKFDMDKNGKVKNPRLRKRIRKITLWERIKEWYNAKTSR